MLVSPYIFVTKLEQLKRTRHAKQIIILKKYNIVSRYWKE